MERLALSYGVVLHFNMCISDYESADSYFTIENYKNEYECSSFKYFAKCE